MIAAAALVLTACGTTKPQASGESATAASGQAEPPQGDQPPAAGPEPKSEPLAGTEVPPVPLPDGVIPPKPLVEEPAQPAKEAPPAASGQPAEQKPPAEENMLETTRRTVHFATEWLAREVDSWFGDMPFDQGGDVKDGRLSLGFLKREDEGLQTRLRFNARVRLPNLEQATRAYFYVGRANTTETVSDTPEALSRSQRLQAETPEEQSFFAGLGYSPGDRFDLRAGFHGIKPYAQARFRQPWTITPVDLFEFRQTFFWQTSDRFGSTTATSLEHAVSSSFAVRWLSAITITQKTRRWDWTSSLGAYKTLGTDRLTSFELVTSGELNSGIGVGEWGVQQKWLQPIYRDWLLGEFLIGYYWPRAGLQFERVGRFAAGFTTTMRF